MSRLLIAATALSVSIGASRAQAQAVFPDDSAISAILRDRVSAGWAPGIVIGIIRPDGSTQVFAEGRNDNGKPLDDRSVFEIGSITKTFTGTLLAEMVGRGETRLDEPVAALLPAGTRVPERNGKAITLVDLATQSSGLPRLPGNMISDNPSNPYASYTDSMLYSFLGGYTLTRDIGSQYEYSNLGVGLLGNALARRKKTSYEDLIRERVLTPLGMTDTRITLTAGLTSRVAQGHDSEGGPVGLWDLPALAGAGGLRSTAHDMLLYLAANIRSRPENTLGMAMLTARDPRRQAGSPIMMIGLGWHIVTRHGLSIVWHNGGTGGYRSFAGFDPVRKIGVVLLTNSSNDSDDIGFHLMDSLVPLVASRSTQPIVLPDTVLAQYAGEYTLAPDFSIAVTREGDKIFGQATGQGRFQLYPRDTREFYVRVVDARVVFLRNDAGTVTGLMLYQNGKEIPGRKTK
ncbi:MAG: serine hydrolase [Gemmatimonadota bacterium]